MNLGSFSISLAVKDLGASTAFYEKFGFSVFAGDASQNWLIMKNGGRQEGGHGQILHRAVRGEPEVSGAEARHGSRGWCGKNAAWIAGSTFRTLPT